MYNVLLKRSWLHKALPKAGFVLIVLFIFSFFVSTGNSAQAIQECQTEEQATSAVESSDAACNCAPTQCRLSAFPLILGKGQYVCVSPGTSVQSAPDASTFKYTDVYWFRNYTEDELRLNRDLRDDFPAVYMDEFSAEVQRRYIPAGAVCQLAEDKSVAYWYNPNYFDIVDGDSNSLPGGQCMTPVLVETDLFGNSVRGTDTFFGCLPNSVNGAVAFAVRLASGVAGGLTVLVIIINLIKMMASSTNPDAVAAARKKLTSAIITLFGLFLSLTLISILGLQIIPLGDYGGGILTIFTGG
ncbi:MAG: hypothetical protein ACOCXT_03370 [Candidatus Dojkabacteria bacterium]